MVSTWGLLSQHSRTIVIEHFVHGVYEEKFYNQVNAKVSGGGVRGKDQFYCTCRSKPKLREFNNSKEEGANDVETVAEESYCL